MQYALSAADVVDLKFSAPFMKAFRLAVCLVLLSWGYTVDANAAVLSTQQRWSNNYARLFKMGRSCQLFGETELFGHVSTFARSLGMPSHSDPQIERCLKAWG